MPYPEIYESIMQAGQKTALEKYAGTYEGAQPTDIATLAQAHQFLGEMRGEAMKRGAPYSEPRILALNFKGTRTEYINVELLKADGFPDDVPIRLLYVHDYGPRIREKEDVSPIPDFTSQARVNEVRDLIYAYYAGPNGPDQVYAFIKQN